MPVQIAKNQPKLIEASIKKPSKIHEIYNRKMMKHQPKIIQKSTKNRSWRPLGASWGGLERLGGLLGASWWPTWFQGEPQKGANIDQTSQQKSINFSMPLGIRFLQDFGGFWEENGAKLASKIEPKTMLSSKGDFLR